MTLLADLYVTFIKIGGFTIGGGLAMIPLIQREVVDVKHWATDEEMADYITVGQSVPGVVGINIATAVGYRMAKFPGALAATLGMITPSIVIIILIAAVFDTFLQWHTVQNAFHGIRAAVVALILLAALRLMKTVVRTKLHVVLAVMVFVGIVVFQISPPVLLGVAALIAVVSSRLYPQKKTGEDER